MKHILIITDENSLFGNIGYVHGEIIFTEYNFIIINFDLVYFNCYPSGWANPYK